PRARDIAVRDQAELDEPRRDPALGAADGRGEMREPVPFLPQPAQALVIVRAPGLAMASWLAVVQSRWCRRLRRSVGEAADDRNEALAVALQLGGTNADHLGEGVEVARAARRHVRERAVVEDDIG